MSDDNNGAAMIGSNSLSSDFCHRTLTCNRAVIFARNIRRSNGENRMLQVIRKFQDLIVTGERRGPRVALTLLAGVALPSLLAAPAPAQRVSFVPGTLVVSRIHFDPDTNPARNGESFPFIFNDPNVSGIQGSIFLDSFRI